MIVILIGVVALPCYAWNNTLSEGVAAKSTRASPTSTSKFKGVPTSKAASETHKAQTSIPRKVVHKHVRREVVKAPHHHSDMQLSADAYKEAPRSRAAALAGSAIDATVSKGDPTVPLWILSISVISSSPMHDNGPIGNMIDSSEANFANFGGSGWKWPSWVVFDLGSTHKVVTLHMKPHVAAESPKKFTLSVGSGPDGPWEKEQTFEEGVAWNTMKEYELAGNYGRYWKLTFKDSFNGAAPTIHYVKFIGMEGERKPGDEQPGGGGADGGHPLQLSESSTDRTARAATVVRLAAVAVQVATYIFT